VRHDLEDLAGRNLDDTTPEDPRANHEDRLPRPPPDLRDDTDAASDTLDAEPLAVLDPVAPVA
jgi:hypothetical protein